jgi:hypothetical protein
MSRANSHKGKSDLWVWALVLLIILIVGVIRARLLSLPLERDEGEYAYTGQLLLQGVAPFKRHSLWPSPRQCPDHHPGFFAGQKIAGKLWRRDRLRNVCRDVPQLFRFWFGRARHPFCRAIRHGRNSRFPARHRVRPAEQFLSGRIALWPGVFDETAGDVFQPFRRGPDRMA